MGFNYATFMVMGTIAAVAAIAEGTAAAATPKYYADLPSFQADIPMSVTDPYSDPKYVFIQNNAVMSAVLGETDYETTGFNNLNIVSNGTYCAGCNGSFRLIFTSTSVGDAMGVGGVGLNITAHSQQQPYFAFITFGDGTTANIQLPNAPSFWGVSAPEKITNIHFGLTMGGTTTGGSFQIDNLAIGKLAGCKMDAECPDDNNVCTSPVCMAGKCGFSNNMNPCDDGSMCTENDTCSNGACAGTMKNCDDNNECTDDTCDDKLGCVAAPNVAPCDDGDMCTEMDVCAGGTCAGTALQCNDDNVCTMDSCNPDMGCVNDATPGCCVGDEDCAVDETCDTDTNTCIPSGVSGSSSGGSTGPVETTGTMETTGGGSSTTAELTTGMTTEPATGTGGGTGTGEPTGGGGSSGDVTTGSLTSGVDTGTGTGGSASDSGGGASDGGCNCTTTPDAQGSAWMWIAALGGLFVRRRRAA